MTLVRNEIARFLYEEKQIPSVEFVENWSETLLLVLYNRYIDRMESERLKSQTSINSNENP